MPRKTASYSSSVVSLISLHVFVHPLLLLCNGPVFRKQPLNHYPCNNNKTIEWLVLPQVSL
jgi:hypothetical protein